VTNKAPDREASAELLAAIERDDAGAVKKLLARDRSLLAHRNERDESPVLVACYRHKQAALGAILAARPDLTIWEAAAAGQLSVVVDHLKSVWSSLATYSHDGWTPLHLAAFFGHAAVVPSSCAASPRWTPGAGTRSPISRFTRARRVGASKYADCWSTPGPT
jgi:ankyrin repeat protein